MITLAAFALVAVANVQVTAPITGDMVRVHVTEKAAFGRGAISFDLPAQWSNQSTRNAFVAKDGSYRTGKFSYQTSEPGQLHISLDIKRPIAPKTPDPKLLEQQDQFFRMLNEAQAVDFRRHEKKTDFSEVKVGSYTGYKGESRVVKLKDLWVTHYSALLRNASNEFVSVSMLVKTSDPASTHANLFSSIVNSIKVP